MTMKVKCNYLLAVLMLTTNCMNVNTGENVSDYFYCLEKGKEYYYKTHMENMEIIRSIKIADIKNERKKILVKTIECITMLDKTDEAIELTTEGKTVEKNEELYEYIIESEIITKRKYANGRKKENIVYLMGPIKIGNHWKVHGAKIGPIEIETEKDNKKKNENKKSQKIASILKKQINIKMTITNIENRFVLGKERKCILVTLDFPNQYSNTKVPTMKLVYAKGLGYIGSVYEDEEYEKLEEVK